MVIVVVDLVEVVVSNRISFGSSFGGFEVVVVVVVVVLVNL